MSLATAEFCPKCDAALTYKQDGVTYSRVLGVEYAPDDPNHYDGISEWKCEECGYREGRWSHRELKDEDVEPRWGGRRFVQW